jgi:hypothetical protein
LAEDRAYSFSTSPEGQKQKTEFLRSQQAAGRSWLKQSLPADLQVAAVLVGGSTASLA